MDYRTEKDALGEKKIPAEKYWGIHTQRALENFPLSGLCVFPGLIRALTTVKKAACLANQELGYLSGPKAKAITSACDEVLEGRFTDSWPLDALQGGAGTSTNMNMNEVLANRAIELLGGTKGQYGLVHPIEDVNMHQSTNDVYPTAVKVAAILGCRALSETVAKLQGSFQQKEKEFAGIVKIGRTELQEAVPMTLGAEFAAFAEAFARDRWRTFKCEERLRVVNLGGTAIGTGLAAPQRYIFLVTEKLRQITGLGLSRSENMVDATANADAFVEVSGILKAHASNLVKIASDLRLMNLLGEIRLPQLQTGSSVMPGKINPVILEAVMQAGLKVMANDLLVTEAASRATLQICEFMPLLAHALLESIDLLTRTDEMFAMHVAGIRADSEKCQSYLDQSEGIMTAFVPRLGYDKAAELLKTFKASGGKNLREFLEEHLGKEIVAKTLSPQNLLSLGHKDYGKNA
ncbi:MAG: aspartate ammonia-lyase [Candidatus Omnitrophica bacterium]|nr:aspartate ammonia-lyase [Candidatus Omnitrophota bacterium]